jgi:ABC-2 type transport system permease protein
VLFLAVFGGALGDRIREIEGIPYLQFILPGLLVMTVASQSFAALLFSRGWRLKP